MYGKGTCEFRGNSIVVSITFTRVLMDENTQDSMKITLDEIKMTYDNISDEERILAFCVMPRTIHEIMEILDHKERKSDRRHIKPLVEQGSLAMTLPDVLKSRNQKYITIK